MAKILVTGGAGFIGSHVADELLKAGHDVLVIDDLSGGDVENVNKNIPFMQVDICDEKIIEDLFDSMKFDYVFHLAAYAAEGLSHFIRNFNYKNNLTGSINLINCSIKHDVKKFIFTSSMAVYGHGTPPFLETDATIPADPYGVAKLAAEMDLKTANEMFGLQYVIFRPHNVYGERQNLADKYRNVIGIFMNKILKDEPVTIYGDGEQTRAFSYIDDVAPIIAESIEDDKWNQQTINIGGDVPFTINEMVGILEKASGKEIKKEHLPARNEVKHAFSNHNKIVSLVGERSNTSLERGLTRMWRWAEKTKIGESKEFENIEITKNLPSFWKKNK